MLQRAGFALPVADHDRLTVRYDDAVSLMRDLRAMGGTNNLAVSDRRPLTRAIIDRAGAIYAERFADDDRRISATFDFVWLSGWAPDESQQQPLRPGAARTGSPMRWAPPRSAPAASLPNREAATGSTPTGSTPSSITARVVRSSMP